MVITFPFCDFFPLKSTGFFFVFVFVSLLFMYVCLLLFVCMHGCEQESQKRKLAPLELKFQCLQNSQLVKWSWDLSS